MHKITAHYKPISFVKLVVTFIPTVIRDPSLYFLYLSLRRFLICDDVFFFVVMHMFSGTLIKVRYNSS